MQADSSRANARFCRKGLRDAHSKGLTPLFVERIARHSEAAGAVPAQLKLLGTPVNESGSPLVLGGCVRG